MMLGRCLLKINPTLNKILSYLILSIFDYIAIDILVDFSGNNVLINAPPV